jgi:hypothetical protein
MGREEGPMERAKELDLLNMDASNRATVSGLYGAISSLRTDDFGLASIFIELENLGTDLGTDAASDTLVLVHCNDHQSPSPPFR